VKEQQKRNQDPQYLSYDSTAQILESKGWLRKDGATNREFVLSYLFEPGKDSRLNFLSLMKEIIDNPYDNPKDEDIQQSLKTPYHFSIDKRINDDGIGGGRYGIELIADYVISDSIVGLWEMAKGSVDKVIQKKTYFDVNLVSLSKEMEIESNMKYYKIRIDAKFLPLDYWTSYPKKQKKIELDLNPILIGDDAKFVRFSSCKYSKICYDETIPDKWYGVIKPNDRKNSPHFLNILDEPVSFLRSEHNSEDRIYHTVNFSFGITNTKIIKFNPKVRVVLEDGSIEEYKFTYELDLSKYDPELLLMPVIAQENSDITDPSLTIISPKITNQTTRTTDHIFNLTGQATDDQGVAFVKVNDAKVPMDSDGKFLKKVRLDLGLNTLDVYAEDMYGNSDKKEIVIYRDEVIEEELEFSDVDIPFATDNNKPNTIAVVFGIEDYKSIPSASYSVNDADIFREYLITTFGIPRKNIYFKLNENATKIEFDKVFSKNGWLSRNSSSSTDIIIYFAGHGTPDVDKNQGYIIPYDGDPYYTGSTCLSMATLYDNLSQIDANSVTILLDACFSGGSRNNESLLAESRPIYIEVETGNIPENTIVFSAASGSEISSSYKEKKHGLFTYYFLKGLSSGADENRDKKITATEMNKYLNSHVLSQAKTMGREQHPQLLGSDLSRIILKY